MNEQLQNALGSGPVLNVRNNIIAGPGPHDYFFHSPGSKIPEVNEEGAWPPQGNIGSLVRQEAFDYKYCNTGTPGIPDVGLSPNCTSAFIPDSYTTKDTCGLNCVTKYPESFGDKDFGFPKDMPYYNKVSNAHQVHVYSNLRAGAPGQTAMTGCIESVPNVTPNSQGTCELNPNPVYDQVPVWYKLKDMKEQYQQVRYTPFKSSTDITMTASPMMRKRA